MLKAVEQQQFEIQFPLHCPILCSFGSVNQISCIFYKKFIEYRLLPLAKETNTSICITVVYMHSKYYIYLPVRCTQFQKICRQHQRNECQQCQQSISCELEQTFRAHTLDLIIKCSIFNSFSFSVFDLSIPIPDMDAPSSAISCLFHSLTPYDAWRK